MHVEPNFIAGSGDPTTGPRNLDRGKLSPGGPTKVALLLLLAGLLGAGAYRLLFDSPVYSEPSPALAKAAIPLIRSGNTIRLPEGSPLRAALTIEPVVAKDVKRDLVLPAVVEADPARLI